MTIVLHFRSASSCSAASAFVEACGKAVYPFALITAALAVFAFGVSCRQPMEPAEPQVIVQPYKDDYALELDVLHARQHEFSDALQVLRARQDAMERKLASKFTHRAWASQHGSRPMEVSR